MNTSLYTTVVTSRLLYLTITLYVYINATLVRHDPNTDKRIPKVIAESIPLAWDGVFRFSLP